MFYLPTQFRPNLPTLEQLNCATHRVPHHNQRKTRKARRQRHAAGDRHAFHR